MYGTMLRACVRACVYTCINIDSRRLSKYYLAKQIPETGFSVYGIVSRCIAVSEEINSGVRVGIRR